RVSAERQRQSSVSVRSRVAVLPRGHTLTACSRKRCSAFGVRQRHAKQLRDCRSYINRAHLLEFYPCLYAVSTRDENPIQVRVIGEITVTAFLLWHGSRYCTSRRARERVTSLGREQDVKRLRIFLRQRQTEDLETIRRDYLRDSFHRLHQLHHFPRHIRRVCWIEIQKSRAAFRQHISCFCQTIRLECY